MHLHTSVSDGSDTPEELLTNIKAAGISVFSVTDHDSFKAADVMRKLLSRGGPAFIPGVEFSCRDEKGKYHILGYGFDTENADIKDAVDFGHALRIKKGKARIEFLKTEFGFVFSDEDVKKLLSLDNPGKPHIGNLMVKYGFCDTKEDAIDNYLNRLALKDDYLKPEAAVRAIISAGGIPVLAHPFYGSGDEIITGEEMEERLRRLKDFGLSGIEAFYSGFTDKLRKEAMRLADKYDLFTTAGSDYHGTNKMVLLGDTGLEDTKEYPERLKAFLERLI